MNILETASARQKIMGIEESCHLALLGQLPAVPLAPARDLEVVGFKQLPTKKGIGYIEGRARLLHDLASIELQAMELGLRTLIEYPEASLEFREQLLEVTVDEGRHFELCLNSMEELGFKWGDWPVHLSLWNTVKTGESLMDRVLIVHRYLEGSGLDAGAKILSRLRGLPERDAAWSAMDRIHREEIGHVDFGSRWYRELCRENRLDADHDFRERMTRLRETLPYRTENLDRESRLKAGFTESELLVLEELRVRERP
ncbi:MAG: DUF455 family protein [Bdellovibrionaceae bacterium]|nr:DUF455 family protein [Pseudobdellovibrionaceae bacterium]